MLKRYIIILVFTILVVIFAVQNVDKVAVRLWMFDLNASLSLIIIITLALGALLALLFTFQEVRSKDKKIRDLNEQIKGLQKKEAETDFSFRDPSDKTI